MPEIDPNGLNANDPGAKLDVGKLRYSLIPTGPLKWLAQLYTVGAIKYSDHGWKAVTKAESRYLDALMRHLEKHRAGEWLDPDTKVPHIIAVAWNAFAICWVKEGKDRHEVEDEECFVPSAQFMKIMRDSKNERY